MLSSSDTKILYSWISQTQERLTSKRNKICDGLSMEPDKETGRGEAKEETDHF